MPSVDPLKVLTALGIPAPHAVTPVAGGWDTLLWRIDAANGQTHALRVFRPDQAATCLREVLVMRTLAERGLPVPSVVAHGTSGDRPAIVMSWCPGQPLLQKLAEQPVLVWKLGTAMGRMHARIHQVPLAEDLLRALPRTDIGERSTSILHMDFHPLNVMTDGRRITGVLDWANVAQGDARADLARTITILRLAPTPASHQLLLMRVLRATLELAWRIGYRREQPSDPFNTMDPFYVWAGEWMERDLRQKLGTPGVWVQPSDLARIIEWTHAHRGRQPAPR